MRRNFRLLVGSIVVLSSLTAVTSGTAEAGKGARTSWVVTFRSGANPRVEAEQERAKGVKVARVFEHALKGMAVELTAREAAALAADPMVASVEPDAPVHLDATQGGATWGIDRADQRTLPLSGTFTYPDSGGAGVKAYVIDTGVRATHSEFAGRVAPGYTAVIDGFGTDDCNGHGTHVAGTIGGRTYGIAKQVTIVPVRVLDCFGSGTLSGVIAGIDWVAANNKGAPAVANMSLGAATSPTVDAAVERLVAAGVTAAVAAGNANVDACATSPARTPSAITVGAIDNTDARAVYSNFGPCVDIFAPGTGITSSWIDADTATNTISGTSMATPHVAGVAALIVAASPGITSSWIDADTATNTISGTSMATPHVAGVAALIVAASPGITPANVAATMMANATPNAVANVGTGSPNRLLYTPPPGTTTPLSVITTSMPNAGTSIAYSASLGAVGGSAPYSWSIAAGALPVGLFLSASTGIVSGVATAAGLSSFTVRVTDGTGASATAALSISVVVVTPAPGAFSKTSPAFTATGRPKSGLVLSWAAATGATRYEYCIDTTNDNACGATWISVGTATSVVLGRLSGLTTYYWHVRAVNSGGITYSNNNTFWRFTTAK